MKKLGTGLALLLAACLLLACAGAENYVESGGRIPDQNVYQENWNDAYLGILYIHSSAIHEYQNRTMAFTMDGRDYRVPCMPVALKDLNGDGVPELFFLEAASGGTRGDLYVYTGDGDSVWCALYVPGITRLDYDDMQGFSISEASGNGGTLLIEHYQYEQPWALQFFRNSRGMYELLNYLTIEADHSGEGEDRFFRNGMQVSDEAYWAAMDNMRDGGTARTVFEYIKGDYVSYGLDTTWEAAVSTLSGNTGAADTGAAPSQQNTSKEIYGLTIDKLATRKGPGTQYEGGGTYSVKGKYIQVLSKAYDKRNKIWWVKCVIPYHGEERILWTGYKRFDKTTLSLDDLPEEVW